MAEKDPQTTDPSVGVSYNRHEANTLLVKMEYVSEILSGYMHLIETSNRLNEQFPQEIKDTIEESGRALSPDQELMALAVNMSKLSSKCRISLFDELCTARTIIKNSADKLRADMKSEFFEDSDVKLISGLLRYVQKLPQKSKNWLGAWVTGSKAGAGGFVILYNNGDKREARHRYSLSQEVAKELGLPEE